MFGQQSSTTPRQGQISSCTSIHIPELIRWFNVEAHGMAKRVHTLNVLNKRGFFGMTPATVDKRDKVIAVLKEREVSSQLFLSFDLLLTTSRPPRRIPPVAISTLSQSATPLRSAFLRRTPQPVATSTLQTSVTSRPHLRSVLKMTLPVATSTSRRSEISLLPPRSVPKMSPPAAISTWLVVTLLLSLLQRQRLPLPRMTQPAATSTFPARNK